MLRLVKLLLVPVVRFFSSRRDLLLENLALRQQLGVLKRRHSHPRLAVTDRVFWVILRGSGTGGDSIDSRPAGDRCAMAPGRLQAVLDLALAASSSRGQEVRQQRATRTYLPHGRRESNLGCAAHSWRTNDDLEQLAADLQSNGAKSFDESWQNLLSAIESKGKELQTVS
jgi:hypothetical protein